MLIILIHLSFLGVGIGLLILLIRSTNLHKPAPRRLFLMNLKQQTRKPLALNTRYSTGGLQPASKYLNSETPAEKLTKAIPDMEGQGRASARIQGELASLLHGDWNTAYRLVAQTRLKFPKRSEQWVWEKTIADLLRDRRR
jgi:hypothetical protein